MTSCGRKRAEENDRKGKKRKEKERKGREEALSWKRPILLVGAAVDGRRTMNSESRLGAGWFAIRELARVNLAGRIFINTAYTYLGL